MPGDNAPNSVSRPPFPNVVMALNKRISVHIATVSVAGGVPSVVQTLSSAGIAVTDAGAGRIGITFPPGGTGAIGWVNASTASQSTPQAAICTVDSDLTNFATGAIEVSVFDAATPSALDITGQFTFQIYVIAA